MIKHALKKAVAGGVCLLCTHVAQGVENCNTLTNKAADLRAQLDATAVAEIPAGEVWRVDGLQMQDGERLIGAGTLCKSSEADVAVEITGDNVSISGLTFSPQTVSGQPNCDIKLGDGSNNARISDNVFTGSSYSAVCGADDTAVGGTPHTNPATGVFITGNTFTGYVRPIFLHSVDNVSITDNILRDSLRDAIRLRENDGHVLISANQFINIGAGVTSTETQDAVDTQWSGHRLVITDNIVRRTESVGFDIKGVSPDDASKGSRSVIIANNHISDTLYSGIVLHGNLDTGEANYSLIVEGNIIEGATRNASYADAAIWAKGAVKYLTIANNQLRSNFARGITVQTRSGQADGTVAGVHVTGNTVINNGVASAASSIGVFLLGVEGAIVSGNTIGNDASLENPTTRYGLYASKVVDGVFTDNILRCNSAQQISVSGTNVIVKDNLEASVSCSTD